MRTKDILSRGVILYFTLTAILPLLFYSFFPELIPFSIEYSQYIQAFVLQLTGYTFLLSLIKLTRIISKVNPTKYLNLLRRNIDYKYSKKRIILLYFSSLIVRLLVFRITGFKSGGEQIDAESQLSVYTNLMHILSGFSSVYVYLIVVYTFTSQKMVLLRYVCTLEVLYYLMFTHSKSGPFLFLLIVIVLYTIYSTIPRKKVLAGIVLITLIFPFYYQYKSLERFAEFTGESISVSESSRLVSQLEFSKLVNPVVMRLDVVSTFAKTIEHYQAHSFDYKFYVNQLYNTYVPRFLDPKKGYSSSHGIFVSKEILGIKKYHTHAAVTPFIEGWMFLGGFGVVLVLVNYTFVIVVLEYFLSRISNPLLRLSLYASSLLNLINVSNVQTLPKYLLIQVFILIPAVRWVTISKTSFKLRN